MCVAGAVRLWQIDRGKSVVFRTLHDPPAAEALPERLRREAPRSMIARMPDGTWRVGYFAWCEILSAIRPTRPLGHVMSWPVFYGIGPRIYRWVAAHRHVVSRILHLPSPCDPDGVCRLDAAHGSAAALQTLFGKP